MKATNMKNTVLKRLALALAMAAGVPGSAAADGLPGEYLLSSRWRDLFTVHSPLTNPSFMAQENYASVRVAFAPVLDGAFKLWEMGVVLPVGLHQSVGLTWLGEDDGRMDATEVDETSGRLVASSGSGPRNVNTFLLASYALNLMGGLNAGVNAAWAYQSTFGSPRQGFGFDVGASYALRTEARFGNHFVGLSTLNLLAPSMSSAAGVTPGNEGEYSRGLKLSWHADYMERQLTSGIDVNFKDFMSSTREFGGTSASLAQRLRTSEWDLTVRLGGWFLRAIEVSGQLAFGQTVVESWGLGLGVNIPRLNGGRDLAAAYQFNMMSESDLTGAHTMYVRAEMGKSRDEVKVQKQKRMASIRPSELYNKARQLLSDAKYWDAYFLFAELVTTYPDFFKNDWASYFMGRCFEELDMRQAAISQYVSAKATYVKSQVWAPADLGIMRIHYRNGDHSAVANQYVELNAPGVPDSLRFHASYLMGETLIRQKNYRRAIEVLAQVPQTHAQYVFARHSIAVAHLLNDDPPEPAYAALELAVQAPTVTPAQKEMVNRSLLLSGYLSYEDGALRQAVSALRMVPKGSFYYEDAQLGLGWTAASARQWDDCIAAGQLLVGATQKDVLRCEGLLLQSLGSFMKNDIGGALRKSEEAFELAKRITLPLGDTLEYERGKYVSQRELYDTLAARAAAVARREGTDQRTPVLDSLHRVQQDTKKNLDAFAVFADDFERSAFFTRSFEEIRNDIEYTNARIKMIQKKGKVQEVSPREKQEEIDRQIQQYQKEMDDLDKKK